MIDLEKYRQTMGLDVLRSWGADAQQKLDEQAAEIERLNEAVRSARTDECHCWSRRVEELNAEIDRLRAADAEHRQAFARIYRALRPELPDRDTWHLEIERLREEVGVLSMACARWEQALKHSDDARRAAVSAEREECALACNEIASSLDNEHNRALGIADEISSVARDCAETIRGRS